MRIDKSIIRIFEDIKKKLYQSNFFKDGQSVIDYLIKIIYKYFGKYIKNSMDYNLLATTFNRNYFWKNLLKCLLFFDYIYESDGAIEEEILDVGCGGAPASIAISFLRSTKAEKKTKVKIIDKSKRQIDIAMCFLEILSIDINSYTNDLFMLEDRKYNELVVFSYFICEQNRKFVELLYDNRINFLKGFVVIDYRRTIEGIRKYFDNDGEDSTLEVINLQYILPNSLIKTIHEKEVNIYGCIYRP